MPEIKLVEVCRSFAYKKNCGNYESRDFFCSQKAEVPEKDAEKTSEALYLFCKSEVMKSVNAYLMDSLEESKPKNIKEKKFVKIGSDWKTRIEKERADYEEEQDKNREKDGIEKANLEANEITEEEKLKPF